MSATGSVFNPVFPGSSEYGSSIHAPRDPSAPSICFLIARTVRNPPPKASSRYAGSRSASTALASRTMTHRRIFSRPSSARFLIRSIMSSGEPASSNVVIPFDRHSSCTISTMRDVSASISSAGRRFRAASISSSTRSDVVSINTPVALPFASRTMRPPAGSFVPFTIPAARSAARFAIDA